MHARYRLPKMPPQVLFFTDRLLKHLPLLEARFGPLLGRPVRRRKVELQLEFRWAREK
jgi:hypothetical protein